MPADKIGRVGGGRRTSCNCRVPLSFSEQERKERRIRALQRLVGDGRLAASLIHEEEDPPSAPDVDGDDTLRSSKPFVDIVNARIEAGLGVNLETVIRRRVLPGYCTVMDGGLEFLLPAWLARDEDAVRSGRFGRRHVPPPQDPLCLRLDRRDGLASVTGDWSRRQLDHACFSPRIPSERRRRLIDLTAKKVLDDFKAAFRVEPPDWSWLRRMRQDPEGVECEAIGIWERLLERVPLALRIPGVEMGIAEFRVLCEGPDGGRDRRWFAEEWPAAASFMLQRGAVKRAFGQVERNRANAKAVAAATLCCSPGGLRRRPCERALFTAGRFPRLKHDAELAELFRDDRFSRQPSRIRGLFMHLNHETRGDLLRRIESNSRFVRPQVEFAIRVAMNPLFSTTTCRFEVGKFVVHILAGSGVDPTTWAELGVEASDVAQALATVSADALAAFAARRQGADGIWPGFNVSSPFETGVLALLRYLHHGSRKRPTPRQLCEFARRVPQLASHRIESLHAAGFVKESEWPAPPEWRKGLVAGLDGVGVILITNIRALRACGERLQNCLRSDTDYDLRAFLGHLVFVSIRADGQEALLSLRAIARDHGSEGVWVERYARDDCKGFANGEPSPGCMEAAQRLTDGLNETLPRRLDPTEVERWRTTVRALDLRTYNQDITAAELWWEGAAERCLPPRFTKQDPAMIVDPLPGEYATRSDRGRRRLSLPGKYEVRSAKRFIRTRSSSMSTFGTAIRDARKRMGWDQRSFASALRMSDKTIADLETRGRPNWPAAHDVLDFMDVYGIEFEKDGSAMRIRKMPELQERYFLTLDFQFDREQDKWVQDISRRMRVVGMSVVRRLNRAKIMASSFDAVELHAPPINKLVFRDLLIEFVDKYGTEFVDKYGAEREIELSINCHVRNAEGLRLTKKIVDTTLWNYGIKDQM